MTEPLWNALVDELAQWCGIEPEYTDNFGQVHITSQETKQTLLKAMGLGLESLAELQEAVAERRNRPWNRLLEPVLVVSQTALPAPWNLYLPLSEPKLPENLEITWEIVDEAGQGQCYRVMGPKLQMAETRRLDEQLYGRMELPLPANLALGYYELQVQVRGADQERRGHMRLIVAPDRVYVPPNLQAGYRTWGWSIPLYALRREYNWGIGDFGDLREILIWAGGELQAGLLGLSPLHALSTRYPEDVSPYAPSSRLYRNLLYLDVEAIPELADCAAAQALIAQPSFQSERERLNRADQIDYTAVWALKRRVLEPLFSTFLARHGPPDFPRTPRGKAFVRYITAEGKPLQTFAIFQSLSEYWRQQDFRGPSWSNWPPAYQDPQGDAVKAYAGQHAWEIQFQQYIQWLLEEQLQQVADQARSLRMPVGLYHDLALGVDHGGHDTWANQGLYALEMEIGAPPDAFNPQGQNWGLPPMIPERLRETGYQHFIETLQKNFRLAGALRVDHVMGLFRLFWIPKDQKPTEGAYVRYCSEELLGILALESMRHKTIIIGEDLGTVPSYIRETLARYQIFSYRLFYFERTPTGGFCPPEAYPALALAAVTTHDLPTLSGFWRDRDIMVKEHLGLHPNPEKADQDRQERQLAKRAILKILKAHNLLPEGFPLDPRAYPDLTADLRWGILGFLAQTPCRLLALNLEDVFGGLDQQNLPGTVHSYPNWRLKMPWTLEQIRQLPQARRLAALMAYYRPLASPDGVRENNQVLLPPA